MDMDTVLMQHITHALGAGRKLLKIRYLRNHTNTCTSFSSPMDRLIHMDFALNDVFFCKCHCFTPTQSVIAQEQDLRAVLTKVQFLKLLDSQKLTRDHLNSSGTYSRGRRIAYEPVTNSFSKQCLTDSQSCGSCLWSQ